MIAYNLVLIFKNLISNPTKFIMADDSSRKQGQLKKFMIEISHIKSNSFHEFEPDKSPSPIEYLAVRSKPSFIIEDFDQRPKLKLCNQISQFLNDGNPSQIQNKEINRNELVTRHSDDIIIKKNESKGKLAKTKRYICCGKCTIT